MYSGKSIRLSTSCFLFDLLDPATATKVAHASHQSPSHSIRYHTPRLFDRTPFCALCGVGVAVLVLIACVSSLCDADWLWWSHANVKWLLYVIINGCFM